MESYEEMRRALENPKLDGNKRDFYKEILKEKQRVENNVKRMAECRKGRQLTLDLYFKPLQ